MRMLQEILGYFLIGLVGFAGLAIFCLPFCLFVRKKKKVSLVRQSAWIILVAGALVVLEATVLGTVIIKFMEGLPVISTEHFYNIIPFHSLVETWAMSEEKKITQMIANVLMFVPLGFIFPAVFDSARKCRKTVICMALFSFAIEIAQYFIGRSADIDDLMLNTVGGGLGYGVFFLVDKLWGKRKFWRKFCARQ